MRATVSVLAGLARLAFAASCPPRGAITVGDASTGANYTTLAAALNDTSSDVYFIYAGTYTGQSYITRPNVTIYGETKNPHSYKSNTVLLTNTLAAADAGSNDLSATVRVAGAATGVQLYNLNIANTYGTVDNHIQAIALSVQSTGTFAAYACQLLAIQDTLLANWGAQFYGKSYIEGSTDFIFGMHSSVWISDTTINTIGDGFVTASGRSTNDTNWYVIDHSVVNGTGDVYLGRPWRDYARVVFQNSWLGSNILPAGWSEWATDDPRTDEILFAEYNNRGPGEWNDERANFSTLLTKPIDILTVLNSTDWIDREYLH